MAVVLLYVPDMLDAVIWRCPFLAPFNLDPVFCNIFVKQIPTLLVTTCGIAREVRVWLLHLF